MAVRNFWLEAEIDGRATPLVGGPGAKDGGFRLTVYIRNAGQSAKALTVWGYENNGQLVVNADDESGKRLHVESAR